MPELPDITVYLECLEPRILDKTIDKVVIRNPFVLRSVDPPVSAVQGKTVRALRRMGKRIVFALESELFLVIHLMIAGRLRWRMPDAKAPGGKLVLAALHFSDGVLYLTEAGTKRRASLHVVHGEDELAAFARGGLEVFESTLDEFALRLRSESHTVKRAITDPRLFSGIGNAYSDEILHRARLSPLVLTGKLTDDEIERLYHATRDTLTAWIERLRADAGDDFPETVTAFREGMAVHGRYG